MKETLSVEQIGVKGGVKGGVKEPNVTKDNSAIFPQPLKNFMNRV